MVMQGDFSGVVEGTPSDMSHEVTFQEVVEGTPFDIHPRWEWSCKMDVRWKWSPMVTFWGVAEWTPSDMHMRWE